MSDISIPGVNSKYDTQKLIEGLLEIEKQPLKRLQDTVATFKTQKDVWLDVNRSLTKFRDTARALFGFQNPFNERVATSSDEAVLTATATRDASEDSKSIRVLQAAGADRFSSSPLSKDFQVPQGTYGFVVGEKEVSFVYRGGPVKDFVETLNRRGKDLIQAKVVQNTKDTQLLIIESLKTGAHNKLMFTQAAENLGISAGILKRTDDLSYSFTLEKDYLLPWTKSLSESNYTIQDSILKLRPGTEMSLPVTRSLPSNPNLVLEFEYRVISKPIAYTQPVPPKGPQLSPLGDVSLQDVTITNVPSQVVLPPWTPPAPPKRVEDMKVVFVSRGGDVAALPELKQTQEFQSMKVPLNSVTDSLSALYLRNNNTEKEIEIRNIRVHDPNARGEFVAQRPLSEARDARIFMDDIEITRDTNSISDLIPGVTVNVHGESEKPVSLKVEPDRKAVKEAIIAFTGTYNRLITDLQILTRTDEKFVEDIQYFTDEERKKASERLGLLQGDLTLNQLRTSLQRIMMNPYTTRDSNNVSLLSHIGISTNATGSTAGGTVDASKLRGYLEINEQKLDQSLKDRLDAVKDLFGRDTDGDLAVDSGVAFSIDTLIRPYVQTGGIIATKTSTIDSQVSRTNRDIDSYTRRLERYEQDLKKKYGTMEGVLSRMEQNSQAIDNFSKAGQSR